MRSKIFLYIFFCLLSIIAKSQNPSGFPFPNAPNSYYNIGWLRVDSGSIPALRDTNWRPLFTGTSVFWPHAGVDTVSWVWDGNHWKRGGGVSTFNGRSGNVTLQGSDVTGALGYTPLQNITNYLQAGSNVTVSGLGTLASPYIINSTGGGGGSGTVTNFSFTNGNGLTGIVTSSTSTPNLSLGTSLTGIISGNGTGFGTVSIGTGLSYFGGVLSATGGTSLNGLVSANGSAFTTANIGAGLSFSGNTLVNTINNTNQLTNGAGFISNVTGLITAGSNITISGSGTSGSPYIINSTGSGSGTVTTFSSGNLSPLFTTSVTNPNTIPALSFTLSNAASNSVFGNNTGSSAAPVYYVPTITTLNGWASGSIALLGTANTWTALQTFGTLTTTGVTKFTGISSGAPTDSILTINPSTGQITWRTGQPFLIGAVQGLHASVTGDSVLMGGFFFMPDTIATLGYGFAITGLPDEATLGAGDSVLVEKAGSKYLTLVPSSAIGGGGAVSSVSNSDGSLTISPTTGAVVASLNVANANTWTANQTFNNGLALGSSITFAATNTYNIGTLANEASQVYTANVSANGGLALSAGSSNTITLAFNGTPQAVLGHAGQLKLNSYTTTTSFTGTPVGVIEFDASGNLLTAALGTNTIAITGTSGGAQSSSAFTFSTTTNTANTALTIPGSSNIFTFTYNPAWDMWDNSRTANNNLFGGASVGNTSLTGVRNIGIGGSGATAITSGNNNILIGVNTGFVITTASDDIFIGYLAGTGDISGGQNVGIGGQALRNNTATQITAVGYQAGSANTSGTSNAYFGFQAGFSNTTGLGNTLIGDQAGKNETTSQHTTAVGWLSLTTLLTGLDNTGVGFGAGSGLTDGGLNTILGSLAMDFAIHNGWNVSIGYKDYALDTAGNGNVVIGNYAASANLGVNSSVIIGDSTLGSVFPVGIGSATRSQSAVLMIGAYNGVVNTPSNMASYDSSIILGYKNRATEGSLTRLVNAIIIGNNDTTTRPGYFITLGDKNNQILNFSYGGGFTTTQLLTHVTRVADLAWNTDTATAIGNGFVYADASGAWHKFGGGSGGGAVSSVTNSDGTLTISPTTGSVVASIALGHGNTWTAAQNMSTDITINGLTVGKGHNSVSNNSVFGVSAGGAFTTGNGNVAIGPSALSVETTGSFSMAIGAFALTNLNGGASVVGIGYQAGQLATTATNSIFIGTQAGAQVTTASANTLIGYQAGNAITTSANNTLIGDLAGLKINSPQNTAIGVGAIENATTGVGKNTAIGYTTGLTLTTGSANVLIGFNVDVPSATSAGYVSLANLFFGQGASATGGSGYQSGSAGIGTPATTTAMATIGILNYNSTYGTQLVTSAGTSNDPVTSASGTVATMAANRFQQPTFTATNTGVTYTTAATVYIDGGPIAGTHVTETNNYALYTSGNVSHVGGQFVLGNSGTTTWNPGAAIPGSIFSQQIGTLNDATTAASGTVSNAYVTGITSPTLSSTNSNVTYTNAYTFWINAAPVAGTNVTITNAYALGVIGNSLFNGTITSGAVNLTGSNDLTGQTGATTITSYAVPGSTTFNTFRVGGYITVTAVSLDVIQLQVTWTDETSTSRTQSFFVQGATTGISTTGANSYSPIDIRVKKGTTITVATILTTGTGSITYDAGATITQLY